MAVAAAAADGAIASNAPFLRLGKYWRRRSAALAAARYSSDEDSSDEDSDEESCQGALDVAMRVPRLALSLSTDRPLGLLAAVLAQVPNSATRGLPHIPNEPATKTALEAATKALEYVSSLFVALRRRRIEREMADLESFEDEE